MNIGDLVAKEIEAIKTVLASLEPLEPDGRIRVLTWIVDKLEIDPKDLT